MPHLKLILDAEPHWPELAQQRERLIHLENSAPPIQIASLPGGMASGKTSVCLRLDLPDGRVVLAQTSLALFLTAAAALEAKYPQEAMGTEVSRALQGASAALRSYQHGNAAPDLARGIADHLDSLLQARATPTEESANPA